MPFSAFTRAVTVTDPGIDGHVRHRRRWAAIVVYDLPRAPIGSVLRRPERAQRSQRLRDLGSQRRRRLRRRWSLVAGFSHTWTREQASGYSGQAVRANLSPLTPNDLINTDDDGRHEFRVWSARAYGTYEGPWGLRITPFLRHQSGQPVRPHVQVTTGSCNLDRCRVLAEPIGTRRMDHVTLFDLRVEKAFPSTRPPSLHVRRRCSTCSTPTRN